MDFEDLPFLIENCRDCPHGYTRNKIVIERKVGTPKIMFIGQSPGDSEDRHGIPFCGKSGGLLNQKLKEHEISDYVIVNIQKCHPPENAPPTEQEIVACVPYLITQIEFYKPEIIVLLGNYSYRTFVSEKIESRGITAISGLSILYIGSMFQYGKLNWSGTIIPILHPSAILHNPINRIKWDFSWNQIKKYIGEDISEDTEDVVTKKADFEDVLATRRVLYKTQASADVKIEESEQKFVHLHQHTEYSLLDAFGRLQSIVNQLKRRGFTAGAITDHGTMSGVFQFWWKMKEAGLKPILGIEAYIIRKIKDKQRGHLVLLAKDVEGYKNLLFLTSWSYKYGFYYKPNMTVEVLREHSKGLICLTACTSSWLRVQQTAEQDEGIEDRIKELIDIFGNDNVFFEVMPHDWLPQVEWNKALMEYSKKFNVKLVATNDNHYLVKEDEKTHEVILNVRKGRKYDVTDLFIRSRQEMFNGFSKQGFGETQINEWLNTTLEIAERCNVEIPLEDKILPDVTIPEGETPETYLKKLVYKGFEERFVEMSVIKKIEYYDRLDYEFDQIHQKGFERYFLVINEYLSWCRK